MMSTKSVVEEREKTVRVEATVCHYNEQDIVLNIAQMRNSHFMGQYHHFPPRTSEDHIQLLIRRVVEQEIIWNKTRTIRANNSLLKPSKRPHTDGMSREMSRLGVSDVPVTDICVQQLRQ